MKGFVNLEGPGPCLTENFEILDRISSFNCKTSPAKTNCFQAENVNETPFFLLDCPPFVFPSLHEAKPPQPFSFHNFNLAT